MCVQLAGPPTGMSEGRKEGVQGCYSQGATHKVQLITLSTLTELSPVTSC
jgi:hypothetical protein